MTPPSVGDVMYAGRGLGWPAFAGVEAGEESWRRAIGSMTGAQRDEFWSELGRASFDDAHQRDAAPFSTLETGGEDPMSRYARSSYPSTTWEHPSSADPAPEPEFTPQERSMQSIVQRAQAFDFDPGHPMIHWRSDALTTKTRWERFQNEATGEERDRVDRDLRAHEERQDRRREDDRIWNERRQRETAPPTPEEARATAEMLEESRRAVEYERSTEGQLDRLNSTMSDVKTLLEKQQGR